MTATLPILTCAPLTVKELAAALGKSEHYVYQMRACGFPMRWHTFPESDVQFLTATEVEAREWIDANNFHLSHENGRGVTNGQMKLRLQSDFVTEINFGVKSKDRQIFQTA